MGARKSFFMRVGLAAVVATCLAAAMPACSGASPNPFSDDAGEVLRPTIDASTAEGPDAADAADGAAPALPGALHITAGADLRTSEDGTKATFTVALGTRPTAPVVVPLASSNEAETKVTPTSLTFTPGDWDKPKTVTLTGQNDDVADGDRVVTIATGPATSMDAAYNGLRGEPVQVTNADDDAAGVETSAPSPNANTTEAGGQVAFTVRLRSKPVANVAIALVSTKPTEGTPDKATLTFTPATWNQVQTVTVTGKDDAAADGDQTYSITLAQAQSLDAKYAAIDPADVALKNLDDDIPGFLVSGAAPGTQTTEAGGAVSFTVRLRSKPTQNVTIPVSSTKTGEGTPDVTELVFTPATYDQPQTVTVTGQNDAIDDGDQAYSIVLGAATSMDAVYAGLDPADVALTNKDDDTAAMLVSMPQPGSQTTEAGGAVTFTIKLATQPVSDVTIAIVSTRPAEGQPDVAQIVLTSANWSAGKTITVTGQADAVVDGDKAYAVSIGPSTSADPLYANLTASVPLVNVDSCGDGTVNGGEQCDDSNKTKCDGCESCERRSWLTLPASASATVSGITAALPRGSMCVEAWAKVGSVVSGDAIIASSYGTGSDGAFLLRCQKLGPVTGRLVFANETGGTVVQAAVDGTSCDDGKWHHFAGCRTVAGAVVTNTVFLDGVKKATASGAATSIGANAAVVLGGTTYVADGLDGAIDEVRISSVVRYTADFVPARRLVTDVDTVALWHLDEGTGTTFVDASGNGYSGAFGAGPGAGWAADTGYSALVCQ
jgi:cysteine-rich repeat protein